MVSLGLQMNFRYGVRIGGPFTRTISYAITNPILFIFFGKFASRDSLTCNPVNVCTFHESLILSTLFSIHLIGCISAGNRTQVLNALFSALPLSYWNDDDHYMYQVPVETIHRWSSTWMSITTFGYSPVGQKMIYTCNIEKKKTFWRPQFVA